MSNPYPRRVIEAVAQMPPDGRALEVGSGGRVLDGRVVSLEVATTPGVDVAAVGESLPFRSGAFDFVLSQAVLEHVQEPHRVVAEMMRVLRPGGYFYAEVAFLQPVHLAPTHFFNHTSFGLEFLCRGLADVDVGPIGSFADVVRWLCIDAGVADVLGMAWIDDVTVALNKLEGRQTMEQRMNVASGVWLWGRKP